MVNIHVPFTKREEQNAAPQREAAQALRGQGFFNKIREAIGQVTSGGQWKERLPHPDNMGKYPAWANKPQARIGIDILTDMVAGSGYYLQMPEESDAYKTDKSNKEAFPNQTQPQQPTAPDGKPGKPEVKPKHKNLGIVETYFKEIGFRDKYRQIQRMKYEMGFQAVERLKDGKLKLLPSDSIYIYRDKFGVTKKYTQEYNNQVVATWLPNDPNFLLFIHNEDPMHPYGRAITESIGELLDAKTQLNIDMPKIIHRYSSPKGIWRYSNDITTIRENVVDSDVNEDLFIGNVQKDELTVEFVEPKAEVKFLPYIDQIDFQIGQELNAPLILLLKNATEASATKMLDAIDRSVKGEQEQNADIIEKQLIDPIVGDPTPEFLHGAPTEVLKEVTLDQIGTLKGNGTITWNQGQDLIRQKGIDLMEDEQPLPPPILAPFGTEPNSKDGKTPLLGKDKVNQLEMSLQLIKDNYVVHQITLTEAMREGGRAIDAYVNKARFEAQHHVSRTLGKPVEALCAETENGFLAVRADLFDMYRKALIPIMVRGDVAVESYTVTPNR